MPGCVLRVSGISFDPEAFLATSQLTPYLIMRRGQKVTTAGERVYEINGFCCEVSNVGIDLAAQIDQATDYLLCHRAELEVLANDEAVQDRRLDFGYNCRLSDDIAAQCDYLPPDFVLLAGSLKIGIELSLYTAPASRSSVLKPIVH